VNESFVRGRLRIFYGDPFDPKAIEKARQDLASSCRAKSDPARRGAAAAHTRP